MARLAGVSRATASRAIIEPQKVSPERRSAVEEAMARLGYVPNAAARSLVTRRTMSIAVVVPEPTRTVFEDPFFQAAIGGINSVLVDADYQLVLLMGDPQGQTQRVRQYLRSRLADGIVVVSHHGSDGVVETAVAAGVPTVLVGRPFSGAVHVAYSDLDNVLGGRIATRRLVEQGCSRIGILTGPLDMVGARDRYDGWRAELAQHGLTGGGIWHGDFDRASGRAAGHEIAKAAIPLDGLFVSSDLMALGVLESLAEHGIRVPQDLKLVGFDDISLAAYHKPALTTVTNSGFDLAAAAAELLLRQLQTGEAQAPRIIQPELVVRESA
ncbi:LacI family DNA-binding transcriptional regulator [Tessaracoccus lubricantis]|uniref:LacI family DNA-binding transcriptional regulator n=1 Tax=Tessaracoccus lubricantis TaxID=545543 RepID=UPI00363F3593